MWREAIIMGAVLIVSSACGDERCGAQPEVIIGTGLTVFDALEDGDSLALEWGPQGGQHVWMALRLRDIYVENPEISLTLHAGETAVGRGMGDWAQWEEVESYSEARGIRIYMIPHARPSGLEWADLGETKLSVKVEDACETGLTETLWVRLN